MPASYAMAARRYMEMYSRGRRGAPAKGVGRVTGARVQISPSPPKQKTTQSGGLLLCRRCRDLNLWGTVTAGARGNERPRCRWQMKRTRVSERTRSIGSAPRVRDRDDYVREVRRSLPSADSQIRHPSVTYICNPLPQRGGVFFVRSDVGI